MKFKKAKSAKDVKLHRIDDNRQNSLKISDQPRTEQVTPMLCVCNDSNRGAV